MNDLVGAKTIRPRFAHIHRRKDLLNILDLLNPGPLIIVSGLIGAGKAALVSSYVETRNLTCLWYQIDQGGEGLATLFRYLGAAAVNANPRGKDDMPLPSPECIAGDSGHVKAYFKKLYESLAMPFLLVFNNYQEVRADSALQRIICDACRQLPEHGRMILIASNDTPPALVWLRTNRSAVIVGWQELRLCPNKFVDETALNARALPALDAVKRLRRRVGNWAAELSLALQSPPDGNDDRADRNNTAPC